MNTEKTPTGAEQVRWDLSFLYTGVDDAQIDRDVDELTVKMVAFKATHKGNLATTLGQAIRDYDAISALQNKIFVYLFLVHSTDLNNDAVNNRMAEAERKVQLAAGDNLTFFDLELVGLDDATMEQLAQDPTVAKHTSWLKMIRINKPHLLTEEVESALTKRASTGSGSWSEFFSEVESDLRFNLEGEEKTLTQMLEILSHDADGERRAAALKGIHEVVAGHFAKYSARTLSMVVSANAIEDRERKYLHPMQGRNVQNQVSDEVVEALHAAVKETAGPLARRYYKLKAGLMGRQTLRWSDRNAPLPFSDTSMTPYPQALETVLAAYADFSPTLAGIVADTIAKKRIDAPAMPGKDSGAYNYSITLPGGESVSFTFLNYLGSNRDVMTLAHELGHGVHGILAGQTQGGLMQHAPMAYAETASVFGEMTTFNFLKKRLAEKNDDKAMLALVCGKIDEMMNTAVRQIGFSEFERLCHGLDRTSGKWNPPARLSVADLDKHWMTTVKELYGEEGEVFTYEYTEHLWCYVSHFHRPFYVYSYAFGELLTQSLYAKREALGAKFEPLYLDMLRAGSTKDAIALLKPFGLDPTNPQFWADGIEVSLGKMVAEAETLAKKVS